MKTKLKFHGENLMEMAKRYQLDRMEKMTDAKKDSYVKDDVVFNPNHGVFLRGDFGRHDRFASFIEAWQESGFDEEMLPQSDFPSHACHLAKKLLEDNVLIVKKRIPQPKDFQTGDVSQILLYPFGKNLNSSYAYRMRQLKVRLSRLFKKEGVFFIRNEKSIMTADVTYHFAEEDTFSDKQLIAFDKTYQVESQKTAHLNIFEPISKDLLQALYNEEVQGAKDVSVYRWNKTKDDVEIVRIPEGLLVEDEHYLSKEEFFEKEMSRLERTVLATQAKMVQSMKAMETYMKQVQRSSDEQQQYLFQQARLRELAEKTD